MNAVVGGLPRSWQTAPSITDDLPRPVEIVDALCAPGRRPSACGPRRRLRGATPVPARIRRAPRAPGNSRSMTPSSSASCSPTDGRAAWSSSFSNSPQIRSAGRSSSARSAGRARACRARASNSKRAANCTRAQHAQAVVAEGARIDRAQDAGAEVAPSVRTDRGTRR